MGLLSLISIFLGLLFANAASAQTLTYEAENLSPVGTGATVSIANDASASGGVVQYLNSTAAGQTMTLTTPSIAAGTYQVQLRYKSNTSRGQHSVQIDGVQVGGTVDQYASTASYFSVTLGNVTFATSGSHTIAMTVTGKNAASTNYILSADTFTFVTQVSQVATPNFSPAGGTYTGAQSVAISSATSGASIRYTTDGSTPTPTVGTLYSAPVSIGTSATLKAIAYATGMTNSAVASATYVIGAPSTNLALNRPASASSIWSATYAASKAVDGTTTSSRWSSASGQIANQWLLVDLGVATSFDSVVIKEISFPRTTAFKIQSSTDGTTFADVASGTTIGAAKTVSFAAVSARYARLYITSASAEPTIDEFEVYSSGGGGGTTASPTFSPAPGSYTTAQSVALSCATSGATIRYTTDGSTPSSTVGTIYSAPITVSTTTTIRAIAYATGLTDSPVASSTYTITTGTGPFRPFPQHTTYFAGTIKPSSVTQSAMDSAVQTKWNAWKAAYLKPAGTGKYYVKYDSTGATVSEAHGYGMLLTVLMAGYDANAKTYFDGLYNYYKAHPSVNNAFLMAWKQDSTFTNVEGPDSATDGDMDIAYSLLLADKQWGSGGTINYLAAAKNCINAIMQSDVNQTLWNLRVGDWATGTQGNYTRPSDFMLEHMKAYKAATGDARWDNVISTTYSVINTVFANNSPNTGLICDFVQHTTTWVPAPESYLPDEQHEPDYAYNSCRTPWRFTVDYLCTGDTRALSQLQKMNSWIKTKTSSTAGNVRDGYTLAGSTFGTSANGCFVVPFGVSAMTDSANQAWLNSVWSWAASSGNESYYDDSVKVLSMVVISGNYWMP
jgi:endo-1,4-beta-D-glucanase Y